jgi:hypothetical protein
VKETWQDLARDSFAAAMELRRAGRFRSCVSRAYFTGFSLVAGELTSAGVTFAEGREGPEHRRVAELVKSNLPGLKPWRRIELMRLIRVLYRSRLEADYRPVIAFGGKEATDSVIRAARVFHLLGVHR